MDAIAEYLIKIEDFPKLLTTLLKENVIDKLIGAATKIDKKTNLEDRFTVVPKLIEKAEDIGRFPLTNLIAYGYARTDSASKYLHKSVEGVLKEKVGLIARPCDTRALIELAKIKQINLDNLFVIAIEDRGMLPKAGREIKKVKDIDITKVVKEKVGDKGLIVKMEDGSSKELDLTISENCLRCFRKLPVVADLTISDLGIPIDSDEIILKVYSEKGNEVVEKSNFDKKSLPDDVKSAHSAKHNEIIEKAKAKRAKDLEDFYINTVIKDNLGVKYAEFIGDEIQKAYVDSYQEYGQNIFDRYVMYADHWIQDNTYRDQDTGEKFNKEALNNELEKIEKPAQIVNPKDFRNDVVNFYYREKAKDGNVPKWDAYEKMKRVIEKRLFSKTEELLPVISFSSKSSKEDESKHKNFVNRMEERGYTDRQIRLVVEWYLRTRKNS